MAQAIHKKSAEAISEHDWEGFAKLYAPEAIVYDPSYPNPLKGREAIRKDMMDFGTAFPDLLARLDSSITADGMLAAEWTMTGTHRGPLVIPGGSIPATNKRIEVKGATFEKLDGEGRVLEERRYYDLAGLMSQLGLAGK